MTGKSAMPSGVQCRPGCRLKPGWSMKRQCGKPKWRQTGGMPKSMSLKPKWECWSSCQKSSMKTRPKAGKIHFGGRGLIGIAINWSCTALQERHCLKQQPRSLRTGFVVSSRMFETLPCLSPTRPEALKLMPSEKTAFSYPRKRVF